VTDFRTRDQIGGAECACLIQTVKDNFQILDDDVDAIPDLTYFVQTCPLKFPYCY